MKISFSVRSSAGLVRAANEDAHYHSADGMPMLFAVFDGMGGLQNGQLAARMAVARIEDAEFDFKNLNNPEEIDAWVQEYVADANGRICDRMRELAVRMGSTLALVVVAEDFIKAYNIGDSRIYVLRAGLFSMISEEHTLAEQKVRMGILTPEQARGHPDRHKLTRHLGIFADEMAIAAAILDPIPLDRPCRLLLCTDGLTDMVDGHRIEDILRGGGDAETTANRLLKEALDNGGADNATCIVLDVQSDAGKGGVTGR